MVRAYLGYLKNEQEVVDDRASRREVSASYYRRNSNRIKALRQMAIRLARETHNDYLPELEAVSADRDEPAFRFRPAAGREIEGRGSAAKHFPLPGVGPRRVRLFISLPGWIRTNRRS